MSNRSIFLLIEDIWEAIEKGYIKGGRRSTCSSGDI